MKPKYIPSEALRQSKVSWDADKEVGQPPPGLIANLTTANMNILLLWQDLCYLCVHGNVPSIAECCLIICVETNKIVKVLESWGQ